MKTAVLTDSTAYLSEEVRNKYDIHMIPLNVIFNNESFQEELEIQASDFYEKVKQEQELPKTSQPAIGYFVKKLEELAIDYDAVISVHLSSGISGTYQSAVAAGNMVENIDMYAFDSETSCTPQGFYAIEASEMARAGKEPKEIMGRLEQMRDSVKTYFMVDDLTHLHRGGRLSSAQAIVGSLLQVKPVLHFVERKIVPFEKIRTRKKALKRMLELFDEDAKAGQPMKVVVIHANREEEAEKIRKQIENEYENVETMLSYFGPVIGTHLGEGAIGIGWYEK